MRWVLVLLALTVSAHAEDAQSLRARVMGWVSTWSYGTIDPAGLTVTPAGEAFVLTAPPFGGSLTVRPEADGLWAIEGLTLPATSTGGLEMGFAGVRAAGVFDPTLARESRLDLTLASYHGGLTRDGATQVTSTGPVESHTLWTPAAPGRVSMTNDTDVQRYALRDDTSGQAMTLTARRIKARSLVADVDFARLGEGLRVLTLMQRNKGTMTPAERKVLHGAIDAFAQVLAGVDSDQVWEDVRFSMGDQSGSVKRMALGFAGRAEAGSVGMKMPIAVEGFASAAMPDPAMREMLPHRLTLTPRISGVSGAALIAALHRGVDAAEDAPNWEAEAGRLLEGAPVTLGVDALGFDVGPMTVTGEGAVKVSAADEIGGGAVLRAKGIEALIKRAQAVPALKPAVPVLIFLKGIGEQEGGEIVWKITYADGEVSVNGTALSDLALPGK